MFTGRIISCFKNYLEIRLTGIIKKYWRLGVAILIYCRISQYSGGCRFQVSTIVKKVVHKLSKNCRLTTLFRIFTVQIYFIRQIYFLSLLILLFLLVL